MTVSTTTSRIVYAGNGVTTIFAFPYRFLVNGDLELTLFAADGTSETLVLTTDYTVTGADSDAGGSVTMIVAPAVGETLVVRRIVDLTQETDYISGDAFPAESHERALDKLTMSDQQLQEQVDRSLTVPLDDVTFSGQLPAIVAERFLRINASGTAIELVDALNAGELAVSPFIETLLDDANAAAARTTLGAQAAGSYASSGAIGSSGLTVSTARGLGRLTAGTGAVEELTSAQITASLVDAATDALPGKIEIATDAEVQTGTDTTRAVTPAGLKAAQIQLGTPVTLTTQTAVDFTGIPSWAKRVVVELVGVSTNGASNPIIQLGDSGGVETSGYLGSASTIGATAASQNYTNGLGLTGAAWLAAAVAHGTIQFQQVVTGTWVGSGVLGRSDTPATITCGTSKSLSGTLDRIRLTTAAGTDQFDAGSVNISWE